MRNIFVGVFLLLGSPLFAQLDNSLISDKITLNTSDSNTWGLTVNNFNYLRNTEYFNDIELGRTLFGYQLNPSLFIQPNDHLKLQTGVFVRSDFGGNPGYNMILPTFSLKIEHKNVCYTFGTLEGALSHQLIEPMFDIAGAIEKRIENGFDIRLGKKSLREGYHRSTAFPERNTFLNAWINWENFIERGSPFKEKFTAGLNITPGFLADYIGVIPVFQSTIHHHGGQIDTDTSSMTMQVNSAFGLKYAFKLSKTHTVVPDIFYLDYRETSNSGYFPYRSGHAWYANLSYRIGSSDKADGFTIMLSYFNGTKFIAPKGSPIYQSVSLDKPGYTQPNRELIFVRFLYNKSLADGLNISARFEPVYNVKPALLDFSYSLYLSYKLDQRFGNLKR